jgi:hypothetical protein
VSCKYCGFVYEDSDLAQDKLNEYYDSLSCYDTEKLTGTAFDDSFVIEREGFKYAIEHIKLHCHLDDPIMDIGCDQGVFLQCLKKDGFSNLTGMEMRDIHLRKLELTGINPIKSSITKPLSGLGRSKFKLITLFHVLEHIADIDSAMNNLRNYLLPQGILIIEVPDASRYIETEQSMFFREHINHFDKHALVNLGNKYGFTILDTLEEVATLKCASPVPSVAVKFQLNRIPNTISYKQICTEKVKEHVLEIRKAYTSMERFIANLIESQESIAIWGAGAVFSTMLTLSNISDCNIDFIVDIDIHKQGKEIGGYQIYDPAVLKEYTGSILVLNSICQLGILKTISEMGLQNKVYVCK